MASERVRLRFSKKGALRFIGHRDLLNTMERLFRRSGLPIAMSEGFHPKQKVSYVSALALGMASDDEVMEVLLDAEFSVEEILEHLNAVTVEGLHFHAAEILPEGGKKSAAKSFLYEIPIPSDLSRDWESRLEVLRTAQSVEVEKSNGKVVDLKPPLLSMERSGDSLIIRLAAQSGPEAGVREYLCYLGLDDLLFRTVFPCRKETSLA
ncbi:MAG: TIGR03936 family radical SAM-associated protein [Thermoguttaceae bacterium]|jgi:radical SAM-linked protein